MAKRYSLDEPPTTNNRNEDKNVIEWMDTWLKSRRNILEQNANATSYQYKKYTPKNNTGDVRASGWNVEHYQNIPNPLTYFKNSTPTRNRVNKLIYSQIENAKNVPVQNVPDNYGNMKYHPTTGMLGVYVKPDYFYNSGNYVAFDGIPTDKVKVHEFTHASHPDPQVDYINNVIFKNNTPDVVEGKHNKSNINAEEIYGALQEVRFDSKLNPKTKVNKTWINNNRSYLKGTYLEKLSDDTLIRLFNEVALNNSNKNINNYV